MKSIIGAMVAVTWILSMTGNVDAQQLKVSTGSKTGTYSKMFNELQEACGSAVGLVEMESSGAVENIDRLIGNRVNAGIVQTDVIYLRAKTDDLGRVKTLFTLYPEEVHIVALSAAKREGGMLGFGGKDVRMETISDLSGKRVGAAGGSVVTARVIQLVGEIAYTIQEYGTSAQALEALSKGAVDAVITVGGAPLPALEALGPQYKLLRVNERMVDKLRTVYVPTRVSYSKMQASTGVTTIATEAIFVTLDYKTADYVNGLLKLRSCVTSKIDELREKAGNHPKWSAVDPTNKGKWIWYEPAVAAQKK